MKKNEMNVTVELAATERKYNESMSELEKIIADTEKALNKKANKAMMEVKLSTDETFKALKTAVNKVNALRARMFYLDNEYMTIITAGKAIPAIEVKAVKNDNNKYTLVTENTTVYPTMQGMKDILPEGIIDKVDVLRREVAYLESGDTLFLTGDVENKKDIPNERVAAMIAKEGNISKAKVKSTLAVVLKDLTGDAFKKEVFTALYNDFARYMMKRTGEWGVRGVVGKSTACDMVLEYAYMYFNNLREVKYTL